MTKSMRTILDGGMGRELKRTGAPFRQPEWSALALMETPELVVAAHQSFINAGAQVVTTNNYAVVPFHIGHQLFEQEGERLTALSGQLARQAVDNISAEATRHKVLVGGSLPPLSGSYRPDLYDADLAQEAYPRLVRALSPYVDIWQAETISSIEEARAIVDALAGDASAGTVKPLWLAFTLTDDTTLKTPCLRSEESLQAALDFSIEVNAEAMLFNCSIPEVITEAIRVVGPLRDEKSKALRLGAYANAFTPRSPTAEANSDNAPLREDLSPENYADIVAGWERNGASIIGGCCGIGPEHIAVLANAYP